ncbi:hypothetical protein [Leucothrix arctica]|uniref:Uncharacterized protein n=1 Tax=Leucothrix arctica TaxID=1481894 RepID=A0A317CC90_9GAMM|nr:hypothetical protein [Leucothrix arctica]PWQ95731.1 hypothetical protein DKT75_11900 [Leucothrix arctica]
MKKLITMLSLTVLLTACGGGGDSETSTSANADGDTTTVGANPDTETPLQENTADLESSADFDFATSRSIAIDFDVAAARTTPGLMSVCSDYSKTDDIYDINYDSCTLQAPLVNGIYSGAMEVTNDINVVVGVVWFKDSSIEPVYKEFALELGARLAGRGAGAQKLVWR